MTPDFLVVGTARAGTTALHYHLRQHPQIFMPRQKEPCFFCFAENKPNYKNGKFSFSTYKHNDYLKLFNKAKSFQIKGEISTPYLFLYDKTINNIRKYHSHPDELKIIIVLRNPIHRAYSQYLWNYM